VGTSRCTDTHDQESIDHHIVNHRTTTEDNTEDNTDQAVAERT